MHRPAFFLALALLALPALANAQGSGPYYARGTFYCSTSLLGTADSCYGYGPALQLYDDGLHGDGAAGDGVYGAYVTCNEAAGGHEFKIANADWSFNGPVSPIDALANGRLWISGPGDVVHFRLDFGTPGYGWVPAIGFANDHAYPAGSTLELIGSAPELGGWANGIPVDHVGSLWSTRVVIASPGSYAYKFRVQGTWASASFGIDYNNTQGQDATFTTTAPNTAMVIQFDELTGRVRAIDDANVPVRARSWGALKTVYR